MDNEVQYLYNILQAVLGKDNALRKQCELQLEQLKTQETNKLCLYLLKILKECNEVAVRTLCSVLLRRYFSALVEDKDNLWIKLSEENKEILKNELLNSLDVERDRSVLHGICDVVSEIAGSMIDLEQKEWKELKTKLFHQMVAATNTDDKKVEAGLKILNTVFPYIADEIIEEPQGTAALLEIFSRTLKHPTSLDIQVSSLQALGSLIEVLSSEDTKPFRALVPDMVQVPLKALKEDEETELETSLITFVEISEAEPKFFKEHYMVVFEAMYKIFEKNDYTNDLIRHQPLEFLVSLVERIVSISTKQPEALKLLCEMIFKIMVDIDSDIPQSWMSPPEGYQVDDDEENQNDSVNFGKGCVDRLISAIGDDIMLPILSALVMASLANTQDWRYKNAALMALSQIGEYIDEIDRVKELVPIMVEHVAHPNPKVRYAALHCLGQIAEDMSGDFQENFHEVILPVLYNSLSDTVPRVQAHACAAVTNFMEGCADTVAETVTKQFLQKLFELVHNGISIVKENAITAISSVGEACKEKFEPYYDETMPLILALLGSSQQKEYKQFRGQTIECITLIAAAVGVEKFRKHAPQVVEQILLIQEHNLEAKDPQRSYLLSAWQRICLILKDEFAPYLERVIPSVLKQASLNPEMSVSGVDKQTSDLSDLLKEVQGGKDEDKESKKFTISTWETEEKEIGINMLCVFIDELKGLFSPYIEQTTKIVVPLIDYSANEAIRSTAASALPGLIRCAKEAKADTTILTNMALYYINALFKALSTEVDVDTMIAQISCIKEIFEEAEVQFLQQEAFNQFADEIFKFLQKSNERKKHQEELKRRGDLEEEEKEMADADIESEEEFQMSVAELLGVLFKTHKGLCIPLLNAIYNNLLPTYMKQDASKMQHKFGVFLLVDMVEFLGTDVIGNIFTQIADAIITFVTDSDYSVRQAAAYGVGMLAIHGKNLFASVSTKALEALIKAVSVPMPQNPSKDTKKRWGHAHDNAVSSIGKVIRHQSAAIGDAQTLVQLIHKWLSYLPLGFDKEEAQQQHELLADILLEQQQLICGANFENLNQVVSIYSKVIGTKFANDSTKQKAKEFFIRLQPVAADKLNAAFANLEPERQARLQKAISE